MIIDAKKIEEPIWRNLSDKINTGAIDFGSLNRNA